MRSFVVACIAVAVIATASAAVLLSVFQEAAAVAFSTEAVDLRPITDAMTTSKTVSPLEIHLNYQGLKELPDQECPTAHLVPSSSALPGQPVGLGCYCAPGHGGS
jgi:hypothetical protein